MEGVWYNYQGDADNGEWLLSQLRLSSFDENGNEVQRTWHNYDANSDNWVPSVQYNISYNDNNDREVYDVSFWDVNSQTWTWSYHYTYQYSETLNEIYGYLVEADSPTVGFWYSGTTIDANELATHTIYQQYSGYYGGYWYNYAQEFYTYDANGNMITNLWQDMVFATGEWRDANLWTMEYVDEFLSVETYQFNDWDYSNGALINSTQYHYSYDEYGNMMEYFTYFFDASIEDWYEYYLTVYTWEEATHDGGEVTGVEYYFESVGDMFRSLEISLNQEEMDVLTVKEI